MLVYSLSSIYNVILKLFKLELWESSHQSSLSKHNGQLPDFLLILLWIVLLKELPCVAPWAHWWSLPPHAMSWGRGWGWFKSVVTHLFCPTREHLSWQIRTCCIKPGLWQQSVTQFHGNQFYSFLLHKPKFTAEHKHCVSIFSWAHPYVVMTNTIVLFLLLVCASYKIWPTMRCFLVCHYEPMSAEALWGSVWLCCIHPDQMNRHNCPVGHKDWPGQMTSKPFCNLCTFWCVWWHQTLNEIILLKLKVLKIW